MGTASRNGLIASRRPKTRSEQGVAPIEISGSVADELHFFGATPDPEIEYPK